MEYSIHSMKLCKDEKKAFIDKILSFEQQYLFECKDRLTAYNEKIAALSSDGIEIRVTLEQMKSSLYGPSEPYDLKKHQKLPKYYSSHILISACKNGITLTYPTNYCKDIRGVCCAFFKLVSGNKDGMMIYQEPLYRFDETIQLLLEETSMFSSK